VFAPGFSSFPGGNFLEKRERVQNQIKAMDDCISMFSAHCPGNSLEEVE
jgi:hypothetical protein